MSNRFDDENNIEMDIKTAFASWGKYVFKVLSAGMPFEVFFIRGFIR